MDALYIEHADYMYMKAAIEKAGHNEVGFLGLIVERDGIQVVKHLEILEQEVSSGGVDFDDEGFAKYLERRIENDELPEGEFGLYSAHSHGNMGVFWSSTDEDGISRYLRGAPFVFSSVFNTKGESKHRVDIAKSRHDVPFVGQLSIEADGIQVISSPEVAKLEAEIDKINREIDELTQADRDKAKADATADFEAFVTTGKSWNWKKDNKSGETVKTSTPQSASDPTLDDDLMQRARHTTTVIWGRKPVLVDVDVELGVSFWLYGDYNDLIRIDFEDITAYDMGQMEDDDREVIEQAKSEYENYSALIVSQYS